LGCPPQFFETALLALGTALDNFAKAGDFSMGQVGESALCDRNEADPEFCCLLEGIDDSIEGAIFGRWGKDATGNPSAAKGDDDPLISL